MEEVRLIEVNEEILADNIKVAEGAKLKIERMPIMMQCNACSSSYEADAAKLGDLVCPACGEKGGTLLSGREYYIKDMEVK